MQVDEIRFILRRGNEASHRRVFVGELYIGDVYPKWGPWTLTPGSMWSARRERKQIGWIASASHLTTDNKSQSLHVHASKRGDAVSELWKAYEECGWKDCPVGKGFRHPWEPKKEHTCKPLPNLTKTIHVQD
jgi:hypothetical protein